MKVSDLTPQELESMEQLRAYTALDNPVRLKAFAFIHEGRSRSFNEIAKRVDVETGLAAYHLGVLKAAGLVAVTYERSGRDTSAYSLTANGERLYASLFRTSPRKRARVGPVRSRGTATR